MKGENMGRARSGERPAQARSGTSVKGTGQRLEGDERIIARGRDTERSVDCALAKRGLAVEPDRSG